MHPIHLAATLVVALALPAAARAQSLCPPDPAPSGDHRSPSDAITNVGEYAFAHSSTRLQAHPERDKVAAGLFWNPPGAFGTGIQRALGAFSSALVVNNPDPDVAVSVDIRFFAPDGTQQGSTVQVVIPPDGTHAMDASPLAANGGPGVGSAHIRVTTEGHPGIVGATLHYFDSIAVPHWGVATDPDVTVSPVNGQVRQGPGEGSYQQLHWGERNAAIEPGGAIYGGPFRFTNTSSSDFDNGSAPILTIANPNDAPVLAGLLVFATASGVAPVNVIADTLNLPPRGSIVYDRLWVALHRLSATFNGNYDFDFTVAVIPVPEPPTEPKGPPITRPLVGDALVIDAFGDDPAGESNRNLNFGRRLRMVSSAMATWPGAIGFGTLRGCDITRIEPKGADEPFIDTRVHVTNVGLAITGDVTIEYFDHFGNPAGADLVTGGLLPGQALHIGFGEALTPGFPARIFNGSIRVSSECRGDRLIGWTHREIGKTPAGWPSQFQYRKAYGEELDGPQGLEHGGVLPFFISAAGYSCFQGVPSSPAGPNTLARYVMPLVRTWATSEPPYWPGYTTFANFTTANTGEHVYRFFEFDGTDATALPCSILELPFAGSSLTFEESDPQPFGPLSLLFLRQGNGSGRVDLDPSAQAVGINVLGDPFSEFEIGLFARPGFGPKNPGTGGPTVEPVEDAVPSGASDDATAP
jgi:hypothetical protein